MWLPDIRSAGLDRYICSQMFGALKVEKPKCEKWTTWSSDDWRHQNSVCILAKYFDQVNIYTASRSLFGWRTPNWTDLIYLVCWEFSRSSTFYESSVNQVNSGSRIKGSRLWSKLHFSELRILFSLLWNSCSGSQTALAFKKQVSRPRPFWNFVDVTLADDDTNSILADELHGILKMVSCWRQYMTQSQML